MAEGTEEPAHDPTRTFNQNRADRLSRFPDPQPAPSLRERPRLSPTAVRREVLSVYLATLDPKGLTAGLAGSGERARHPLEGGGDRLALLARAVEPSRKRVLSDVPSVAAAPTVDYGDLAELVRRDPGRAAERLREVLDDRPDDGRLWQLLGAARMALEDYPGAAKALQRALEQGRDAPVVHQALGDALLAEGDAEAALEHYRQGPETGRNRLGRAVALVQLDRPEKALPLLDEAQELAPGLEARIRAVRAGALKLAERHAEARRELARGRALAPQDALARSYARIRRAGKRSARVWGFDVEVGVGYNDNVALRSDSAPGGNTDTDDVVLHPSGSAWARLAGNARTRLLAEADIRAAQHTDLTRFNEVFTGGGLRIQHRLAETWQLEARGGGRYGQVDGDSFYHAGEAAAIARWSPADWSRTELTYTFSQRDFLFRTVPEEDRDGSLHRGILSQRVDLPAPGGRLELSPFLSVSREETEGASAENTGWSAGLDTQYGLFDRLALSAGAGYREHHYDNPHVRTGFAFKREDEAWYVNAGMAYHFAQAARAAIRYSYLDRDSNIPASFSYDQNQVQVIVGLGRP